MAAAAEPPAGRRTADVRRRRAPPQAHHLHRAPRHADYLVEQLRTLLGREEAVVAIHGGVDREERRSGPGARSRQDPDCRVLVATDAAGEGINLQRAHLMVNYDLPWNPNRIEQRFGRIHRIGQTEVCHLWNLVADETRAKGEVFHSAAGQARGAAPGLGARSSTCSARRSMVHHCAAADRCDPLR